MIGKLAKAGILLLGLMGGIVKADPTVTDFTLVSEKRITRTIFEYTYKATITNDDTARKNVQATLTGAGTGTTIIEGVINVGLLSANQAITPVDTVTIRQDRALPFNQAALVWNIQSEANLTPKQEIQLLEDKGILPKLDRSSDVQGPDVNANGIRDDVETYIATNYTTTPQRAAAEQFARVVQTAMLVDTADSAAVKAESLKSSKAVHCIYTRFDGSLGTKQPAAVVQEIESISTSTKERLLAYLAFSKALDGTAGSLPRGDTCE